MMRRRHYSQRTVSACTGGKSVNSEGFSPRRSDFYGEAAIVTEIAVALVAQLDRASDFESEGREFESLRARHEIKNLVERALPRKVIWKYMGSKPTRSDRKKGATKAPDWFGMANSECTAMHLI